MKTSTSIQSNNRTIEQSNNFHRGSALLIVLGMLSFMVVSAVGFSIYMRQGRVPSSYLRRNVSSRYLVKAALANALENLEGGIMSKSEIGIDTSKNSGNNNDYFFYGVYDDPFPGVTMLKQGDREAVTDYTYRETGEKCRGGDFWFKRVFCPFGLLDDPRDQNDAINYPSETVPTLTLEALAYLPPAIIDDVRKVSRLTRTAKWQSLPYQAGRYAYTVVNVSDMFDVNRLRANVARNSGRDRITLSTLTSGDPADPAAVDGGRAGALDVILDKPLNTTIGGEVVPFTSLADFNLAAGNSAYAPFMQYVGTGNSALLQAGALEAANAIFTTDTWFPSTNSFGIGSHFFDLGGVDGKHQPFKKDKFVARSFVDVAESCENTEDQVNLVYERNLGIGMACLYDYLDSDSVPISLALPTTEAVPMVVGVSGPHPQGESQSCGFNVDIGNIGGEETAEYAASGYYFDEEGGKVPVPAVKVKRTYQKVGITSFGSAKVSCLVAFPFKRMVTTQRYKSGDFKYRGMMKVWLAPADMGCRASTTFALYPEKNTMTSLGNVNAVAENGVATFLTGTFLTGKTLSHWSSDVKNTQEALEEITLDFDNLDIDMPIFRRVKEEIVPNQVPGKTLQLDKPELCSTDPYLSIAEMNIDNGETKSALRPLNLDGDYHNEWVQLAKKATFKPNEAEGVTKFLDTDITATYRLYAAIWVQIVNKEGKVVDMVPACLTDDKEWLENNVPDKGRTQQICGTGAPLLNFMSSDAIEFKQAMLESDALKKPRFTDWTELFAVDPRFNFAPEDWYAKKVEGDVSLKDTWIADLGLNSADSPILGKDGRDRDIFMFVSDQEYLQSIGELAFLPRLERFRENNGDNIFLDGFDYAPDFNGLKFADRLGSPATVLMDQFANGRLFWRTYSPYLTSTDAIENDDFRGTKYADPYKMYDKRNSQNLSHATFLSDTGTFKVNPYSDDNRVLAAALVNTPFDYYVASTNENQQQSGGKKNTLIQSLTPSNMKTTYGWGDSAVAKISNNEILDIMDLLRDEMKSGEAVQWTNVWNNLEWQREESQYVNDNNSQFLGATLGVGDSGLMHGVDRKFLYSYWRDCFDNSQQLFLIFVRAEASSVGGGASGGVSAAQLGGRAVALVWRDPSVPVARAGGTRPERENITSREGFRNLKKDYPPHRTRVLFYHQFD